MKMKTDLRTRLMTLGILGTVIPLLVVIALVIVQDTNITRIATGQTKELVMANLDNILDCTFEAIRIQQTTLVENLRTSKEGALVTLRRAGRVSQGSEQVAWQAVNQFSKETTSVTLPKLLVGGSWPGQERDPGREVLAVDEIRKLTGASSTIFQRMNSAGDMIRVATNVTGQDGKRAIGTYIPVRNPDGSPNPVLAEVLNGRTFIGRAFVVDAWYNAAYEPLRGENGEVIGMLYVGVKQTGQDVLYEHLRAVRIAQSGYIFVLNAKGQDRGKYVVSKDGKRDGENIWEARDADGKLFIQDMCQRALALGPNEIGEIRYEWLNPGETQSRLKITHFVYFQPWDWVIGCGIYADEMRDVVNLVSDVAKHSLLWIIALTLVAVLAAIVVWFQLAKSLTGKVMRVSDNLAKGANQITSASGQISEASQALAEGASEQASALEEISSALEEMTSVTRQNADNAKSANDVAKEAHNAAEKGSQAMSRMGEAIRQIKSSSDQTAKILKTIDEIAFQTNLLALNAAVEAARAGEAGKGFAVVAEEVRNLAMRSAEAAKNTAALIEDSQRNSDNGVSVSEEVDQILGQIVSGARHVTTLVEGVATASHEQARGIDQIAKNVAQMDKVTQSNASTAEESASSSEELSAQARELREIVNQLVEIVGHGSEAGQSDRLAGMDHGAPQAAPRVMPAGQTALQRARAAFQGRFQDPKVVKPGAGAARTASKPQDVIPLDDKELSEF